MKLCTARLCLCEFTLDDGPAWLAHHQDPRYVAQYDPQEVAPERLWRLLDMFIAWQQEQPRYRWQMAVHLAATGELIGNCGIRLKAPGAAQAELGYGLAASHWGQGYVTEAARRMLQFTFEELNVHRVEAHIVENNLRSVAVVQRLGFVQEGQLREDQLVAGVWRDTLLFGLLADEWRGLAPSV